MQLNEWLTLFLLPSISSLIGWFTNYIAVKMLLKPLKPVNVLGMTIQGILPRRHADLAERVSDAIARDFLTERDIVNFLKKADPVSVLRKLILEKWNEKIGEMLESFPMISMFLSEERLDEIRDKLLEALFKESDHLLELLAHNLEEHMDLRETIRTNILAFDLERLESIIEEIAKKEFRFIERLGGVLGLLIGIVQAVIVLWVIPRG